MRPLVGLIITAILGAPAAGGAQALDHEEIARIDRAVWAALAGSGAPSAAIAVVRGGRLVLEKAYGVRAIAPARAAGVASRYRIGAALEPMTATAVLMLVQDGTLSLDDPVGRWLPELIDADKVTVREILSHTAGYKAYSTVEVLPREAFKPVAPRAIADRWAREPLDAAPGSAWRDSDTDDVIAGLIVERASGQALARFLRQRMFQPLRMTSVAEVSIKPPAEVDAQGYTRYALGPLRAAQRPGAGWRFGAGGWAMTAGDLARWDAGVLRHSLLTSTAYDLQQTPVRLTGGATAPYGLGVFVDQTGGHKRLRQSGAEAGFQAENRLYPEDGAAAVVMVNADFGDAQDEIADAIEGVLIGVSAPAGAAPPAPPLPALQSPSRPQDLALARRLFDAVSAGQLDRSRLTADANRYFSPPVLADYRRGLAPLGPPTAFEALGRERVDGLDVSLYRLTWKTRTLLAVLRLQPDRQVAAFTVCEPNRRFPPGDPNPSPTPAPAPAG